MDKEHPFYATFLKKNDHKMCEYMGDGRSDSLLFYGKHEKIENMGFNLVFSHQPAKKGMIAFGGKTLAPCIYDDCKRIAENGWCCFDNDGISPSSIYWPGSQLEKLAVKTIFRKWLGGTMMAYEENGKVGIMDTLGKVLIKPMFERIEAFKDGFVVFGEGENVGLANTNGEVLLKSQNCPAFNKVIQKGAINYCVSGHNVNATKVGYVFLTQSGRSTKVYDSIADLNKKAIVGLLNDHQVLIDRETADILQDSITTVSRTNSDNILIVKKSDKYYLYDIALHRIVSKEYYHISSIQYSRIGQNVLIIANRDYKKGLMDYNGKELTDLVYDGFSDININEFIVNNKMGVLDANYLPAIPAEYDRVFKQDSFMFAQNKERIDVYISDKDTWIKIEDWVQKNKPVLDLIPINKAGKWGFVNQKGEETIPCQFMAITPMIKGRALAMVPNLNYPVKINQAGLGVFEY